MRITKIATRDLKASDVPPLADTWFVETPNGEDSRLIEFALSFDGYEFFGPAASDDTQLYQICFPIEEAYCNHPNILKAFNTTGLRLLLFFQQRREREQIRMSDYAKVLIEAIRARLSNQ